MNRKLLFIERFIYGDGCTPKNIAFTVKIHGTFPAHRLRQTLNKIQARHPPLTAGIVEDAQGTPWFVTPAVIPEIPLRIMERYTDNDWIQTAEAECHLPFNMQQGPLMRLVWLQGKEASELMLVCHHVICDGASLVTLCREILMLVDRPDTEITPHPTFSTIGELVPANILTDKGIRLKGRLLVWLLRVLLFLKRPRKHVPRGRSYTLRWELDPAATAALTARCRQEQVTIHTTLCVAFLEAFRQAPGSRIVHNKIYAPVNLRRFLPAIKPDMLLGFASAVDLRLDNNREAGFFDKARQLHKQLHQKLDAIKQQRILVLYECQHALVQRLEKYFIAAKGKPVFTFSNLGRLDIPASYHSFEVVAVYNPVQVFKSANPYFIIASTFEGRLSFSLLSDDHYLPEQEAEAIKNKVMELLMGLQEDSHSFISTSAYQRISTSKTQT
ncbi:phthiocerol/phthiodiolone dimycocerosyl transferase family protein [Chitinophaga japonensis]|uniref:Phthiocerol/phthiodiolone dimycocerosyl transferase n=1 Tax=Chitinophaga japonensis TaxID=104662 RepID=A0A562T942_CHIJA|nr:condensation domain-containing protein [Chitinophaga japonensis]TWI89320.1 condensation domain-containing protein [Chitinophaga japonensis]